MKPVLLMPFACAMLATCFEISRGGETRLGELLQDPSRFDGRTVVLHGTVIRLQPHTSRKGDRYYTFILSDDGKEVLVLMNGRPTGKTGTMVTVRGRFDHPSKRVDAVSVICEQDPGR